LIGDKAETLLGEKVCRIVVRDTIITFIITLIATLIANPPFHVDLIIWCENIYVPILTAIMTAVVSYAHTVGVKHDEKEG